MATVHVRRCLNSESSGYRYFIKNTHALNQSVDINVCYDGLVKQHKDGISTKFTF